MRQPTSNRYLAGVIAALLLLGAGCVRDASERKATLPAGTTLVIRLDETLDTGRNRSGDAVLGQTAEALFVGDAMVVPAGATVRGSLSEVRESGRVKGRASMTIHFNEIEIADQGPHPIEVQPLRLVARSEARDDVQKVAAGGLIGGIVGAVVGGGKGAAIGGAIGLGTGTAVVLATKGEEIHLGSGQRLVVRLERPVELPVHPLSMSDGRGHGG